jgi:hypothetical protein
MPMRLTVTLCTGSALALLFATGVNRAATDVVSTSAANATVTVYRPKQWGAGGSVVELDGLPTAELAPGNQVTLSVAPGSHTVSQHGSERITVDAKPGQSYFIKAWLGFGIINPDEHLALVTPEKASKEITCCKSVSLAAWIVPDPEVSLDAGVESPLTAGNGVLVGAEWIPNAAQEGGWAIYRATLTVEAQILRIDLGAHSLRVPLATIAAAENGGHRHICWVTVRRTSGHVDQIRATDCAALYQFGAHLRAGLSGASSAAAEIASQLGPLITAYDGYRMVDSSGPDCPFPGYTGEHDGGPFEIHDLGLVWGVGGKLPTVLRIDDIAEVMPLHHILTMTWLPLRRKGGACIFVQLRRNVWGAKELENEARAIILKQVSPGVPETRE